jgi:hypothetical protein
LRKGCEALVTSRLRLPPGNDLFLGYAACAFPIFVWSIYHVFKEVPAWLIRLSTWDLIGAVAYTQAFALVESLIVFILLTILAALLPASILRSHFSSLSLTIILVTSVWFILAHFNAETIRLWGGKQFLIWGMLYTLSLAVAIFLVYQLKFLQRVIDAALQRLSVLSYIYVFIGIVSLIIVIVRNI